MAYTASTSKSPTPQFPDGLKQFRRAKLQISTAAVDFLNRVRTRFHGSHSYDKFLYFMKACKCGEMSDFEVYEGVVKLLGKEEDLVARFRSLVPESYVSLEKMKVDNLEANFYFLKRVWARSGGELYGRFLDLMVDYKNRVLRDSDIYDEVAKLFEEDADLLELFTALVPESYISHSHSRKRKRKRKKTDDSFEANWCYPPAKKRKKTPEQIVDFGMEESLCEVDVRISNLESTYETARRLSCGDGKVSFTALNLAVIRNLPRRRVPIKTGESMLEIMELLRKKRETLKESRDSIIKGWNESRQSR